jgi:hypothetical protein
MQIPAFADHGNGGRGRFEQGTNAGVILDGIAGTTGASKSNQFGVFERTVGKALEELGLFGIALREAAFDVIHTELIQFSGNQEFVLGRKTDAFGLHSIA